MLIHFSKVILATIDYNERKAKKIDVFLSNKLVFLFSIQNFRKTLSFSLPRRCASNRISG